MKSPTPAPVFIPPGGGRRRAPQPIAPRGAAPALVGGWYLAKALAVLAGVFGVAGGVFYVMDSRESTARVAQDFISSLGGTFYVCYLLMVVLAGLYIIAWLIVTLVALCQGYGKGALLYLVGSPVVIAAGVLIGAVVGAGAAKLFFLL